MSEFRNNIPGYKPPDPAAWKHGVMPYSLEHVRDAYVSRASASVSRDYSSIEFDKTTNSRVALDAVCERVHADSNLPDNHHVFFDPENGQFWVYPEKEF